MKRTQWHLVTRLLILPAALLAVVWVLPAPAQLILSEVLADPATDWNGDGTVDFLGDEWIEVRNTGTGSLDLAEYWVRDGVGTSPQMHLDGSLAPGEVKVFYGSDAVAWQQANSAGSGGLSLNNGGDTVELLRNRYENGNLMELEVVDGVVYADHVADDDRSLGWDPEHGGWILYDALNPYSGSTWPTGSGCAPSPGAVNLCESLVGADQATWGQLKATFQ